MRRFVLEQLKAKQDYELRSRALSLKESEYEINFKEQALKDSERKISSWKNPIVVAILAATVAATGNAVVALINGHQERGTESQKSEDARILEMVKTGDTEIAAENLEFLVSAGLISNKERIEKIEEFLKNRVGGKGPVLPSGVSAASRTNVEILHWSYCSETHEFRTAISFSGVSEELAKSERLWVAIRTIGKNLTESENYNDRRSHKYKHFIGPLELRSQLIVVKADQEFTSSAASDNVAVEAVYLSVDRSLELPRSFSPCLLYTSPSPRDQRGSRMPSSA